MVIYHTPCRCSSRPPRSLRSNRLSLTPIDVVAYSSTDRWGADRTRPTVATSDRLRTKSEGPATEACDLVGNDDVALPDCQARTECLKQMTSQGASSSVRLHVTNFGPINGAEIELRPLTVFVGPSNTGKSYMAMLIYALHRAIADLVDPFSRSYDPALWRLAPPIWHDAGKVPDDVIEDLERWIKEATEGSQVGRGATLETGPLPVSVASMVDDIVWGTDETSTRIKNEITRCFGVDNLSTLIRRQSGMHSSVDIRTSSARGNELLRLSLEMKRDRLSVRGSTSTTTPIRINKRSSMYLREYIVDNTRRAKRTSGRSKRRPLMPKSTPIPWFIFESIFPQLLGGLSRKSYYLPADRTGIIHAHRVVVSALIEAAATAGLRPTHSLPMLSGVLSDFLQALIRIGSKVSNEDTSKSEASSMIEENMLDGTIHIDQTPTGYPSFTYRPTGWRKSLPLMHTSSMVSELAPIILYLQQIVHRGDLLIIEEPESHLHPAMQAKFAKILAAIVRKGVRIIVTTHSDWFLEQIGNLVRLSGLPVEDRDQITDGTALERSDVGAWLFEETGDGGSSQVTEIEVDPDTGLYPVDYGRISDSLYNESAKIFNKMQERKDRE